MTTLNAFAPATKKVSKLRLAIFGTSGSGKTFTALRVAKGMGGRVAVIDTEHGSASKYADRFDFDVNNLLDKSIDGYIAMMKLAHGYDVLVVDSISHAWQILLMENDNLAKAKYHGNTFGAWSESTPRQRTLVDAFLSYPGHIIATMRSKTEWTVTDNHGKKTPTRIGMSPEQGKGIEYEFDMLLEMSPEHVGLVLKDRTGRYQDKSIDKPGEELGKDLMGWLNDGIDPYAMDADMFPSAVKLQELLSVINPEKWANAGTETVWRWLVDLAPTMNRTMGDDFVEFMIGATRKKYESIHPPEVRTPAPDPSPESGAGADIKHAADCICAGCEDARAKSKPPDDVKHAADCTCDHCRQGKPATNKGEPGDGNPASHPIDCSCVDCSPTPPDDETMPPSDRPVSAPVSGPMPTGESEPIW